MREKKEKKTSRNEKKAFIQKNEKSRNFYGIVYFVFYKYFQCWLFKESVYVI